jgi:hypothetical protein
LGLVGFLVLGLGMLGIGVWSLFLNVDLRGFVMIDEGWLMLYCKAIGELRWNVIFFDTW